MRAPHLIDTLGRVIGAFEVVWVINARAVNTAVEQEQGVLVEIVNYQFGHGFSTVVIERLRVVAPPILADCARIKINVGAQGVWLSPVEMNKVEIIAVPIDEVPLVGLGTEICRIQPLEGRAAVPVSYTHLRATRPYLISYAVFCLKKKHNYTTTQHHKL